MSLISDALKKARQEAARQDALRQGVPYAIGAADAPVRRAPWLSLLAGLGAGCLLAGVVFALAYFAGWGPFRKGGVETRVAQAAQAPAPVMPQPSVAPPVVAQPAAPAVKPQEAPPPAVATPIAPKPEPRAGSPSRLPSRRRPPAVPLRSPRLPRRRPRRQSRPPRRSPWSPIRLR